jgi:hypothetical protein
VLDRRLGLTLYAVQAAIIIYFVFNLVVKKMYLETEKTTGWITSQILQSQRSDLGVMWDNYDRVTNPGELGAMFVPTRVEITRGQTQKADLYCKAPLHKCKVDKDCDIENKLLQLPECNDGYCMRHQWCPAEDPNDEFGEGVTEIHYLDTSEVEVWYETFVHFHYFDLDVATTDESMPREYPMKRANTYPFHDIIRLAKLKQEEVLENGAIVLMNAIFECELTKKECETYLEATNVDTLTGYNHVWNNIYYEDGVRKRDSYRMYGVRLINFATGFGRQFSINAVILQFASFISMVSAAAAAADFYMQNIVPEREAYKQKKCIETEDFND